MTGRTTVIFLFIAKTGANETLQRRFLTKKKKDFYLYAYKRVRKWNQDHLKLHVAKRIVRPTMKNT